MEAVTSGEEKIKNYLSWSIKLIFAIALVLSLLSPYSTNSIINILRILIAVTGYIFIVILLISAGQVKLPWGQSHEFLAVDYFFSGIFKNIRQVAVAFYLSSFLFLWPLRGQIDQIFLYHVTGLIPYFWFYALISMLVLFIKPSIIGNLIGNKQKAINTFEIFTLFGAATSVIITMLLTLITLSSAVVSAFSL